MKKIAVTGGICSGKTTICKHIEDLGYGVLYFDNVAHEIADTDKTIREEIISEFGIESYIDNKYNRKYIGHIVFNNIEKLNKLNEIFKPYLENYLNIFLDNFKKDICFFESALIFEHNMKDKFDYIIDVYVKMDIIIERLKKRYNLTELECFNVIEKQYSSITKANMSDFIIINNINDDYKSQIENIIKHIQNI